MDPVTMGLVLGGGQLLGSTIGGYFQKSAAEEAARAQIAAARMGIQEQRQAYKDALPYLEPYSQAGQEGLGMLLGGVKSGQFIGPEMPEFEYGRTTEEFLDPSIDYQQRKIREQLEQSAAAGGQLSSGATLKALQQEAQDRAMMDYQNAFGRQQADKAFNYQDFINRFNISRQNVADRYNQIQGLAGVGLGAGQSIANLRSGNASNIANLMQQQGSAQATAAAAPGVLGANIAGGVTNAIGSGLGAYNQQRLLNTLLGQLQPQQPQVTSTGFNMQTPTANPNLGNFGMGAAYGPGGYITQGNIGGQ